MIHAWTQCKACLAQLSIPCLDVRMLQCKNHSDVCATETLRGRLQERASGMYRLSAIYFARSAADLPLDFAIPTVFILIVYLMGHLRYTAAAFFANYFTVLLLALVRAARRHSTVFDQVQCSASPCHDVQLMCALYLRAACLQAICKAPQPVHRACMGKAGGMKARGCGDRSPRAWGC